MTSDKKTLDMEIIVIYIHVKKSVKINEII